MKWQDIGDIPCSIARSLAVLGDRWTMMVLRNAFLGIKRFDDFQTNLGVTRHVLAERLQRLVEAGVFAKVPYQQKPERFEYRLTEKGRDLYPVLLAQPETTSQSAMCLALVTNKRYRLCGAFSPRSRAGLA